MKLFVGLGNPGKLYLNTRHNVGHQIIDILKTKDLLHAKFETNTGFMNEAGLSVQKVINFYKVDLKDFYLIHDDLDIPIGEFKVQFDRGPAGHHGVESVIAHLGSQSFTRIRVGVGKPTNNIPIEDYVLQKFSVNEKKLLSPVITDIITLVNKIVEQ